MTKKGDSSKPGPKARQRAELAPGTPKIPHELTADARRIWRQLAPALVEAGLLAPTDAGPFALYCQTLAMALATAKDLGAEGLTTEDRNHGGQPRKNPKWMIFTQATQLVMAMSNHFGTTAKARQGLPVEAEQMSLAEMLMNEVMQDGNVITGPDAGGARGADW